VGSLIVLWPEDPVPAHLCAGSRWARRAVLALLRRANEAQQRPPVRRLRRHYAAPQVPSFAKALTRRAWVRALRDTANHVRRHV